jgi:hypothetical protein
MNNAMKIISFLQGKLLNFLFLILVFSHEALAQVRMVLPDEDAPEPAEDFTWWYVSLFVLTVGLTGAIVWKFKNKEAEQKTSQAAEKRKRQNKREGSLDAEKELEWLRKNQKIVNKNHGRRTPGKNLPENFPQTSKVFNRSKPGAVAAETEKSGELPVFSIRQIERARPFDTLSISNDESLISAIEQAYDEFEEDEKVRELAVRVLAAFKTRNSVEALSQMALYDLSSNLRSKAVSILADFDHESVFETILAACADPTREVKAAAARALFKLTFDRSDAWTRISESGDTYRMKHAARAAIAGDLVERSFDRLVHQDKKVVYEAFALVALLINAGETADIFKAIEYHRNPKVKLALLHVIKVLKKEETLSGLYSLLEVGNLPDDIKQAVDKTIESFELVAA